MSYRTVDELLDETSQLTTEYGHVFGVWPREEALESLIDIAGQLARKHDQIADEYRRHVERLANRARLRDCFAERTAETTTDGKEVPDG